ncbi:MAG: hypothetical protein K5984_07475, partial [Bacteroidales bacterium]|nr:hypothetical protein [Bacteroidales bacterium]
MGAFKRADLEDIKSFFGARSSHFRTKAELVDYLATFIVDNPAKWMNRMLERDLRLLKRLVEAGPDQWVYLELADYPTVLETVHLIIVDQEEMNFRKLKVSDDVYKVVAPYVDAAILDGEKSGRFEMEEVALGIMNIYGVLPYLEFVEMMWNHFSVKYEKIGSEAFVDAVAAMPIVSLCMYDDEKYGRYMASPCVAEPMDIFLDREDIVGDAIKEFKRYSPEEEQAAGMGAPYFSFGIDRPEGRAVMEMLRDLGYDDEELTREIHDIWMNSQSVMDEHSTEALLSCVNRRKDSIADFETYQQCMQKVADYSNSLPKWLLKGQTPNEADLLKVVLRSEEKEWA